MKRIDFTNPEIFQNLEKQAFQGILDYDRFPPPEYKYFARYEQLAYKYRSKTHSLAFCEEQKRLIYREYQQETNERLQGVERYLWHQENIRRSGVLRAEINKAAWADKLEPALKLIGLMTGDTTFYSCNMRCRPEIGVMI